VRKPGFIGLGVMGAPMARRVMAKYGETIVFDLDAARMQSVACANAVMAGGVAEVGKSAEVVILSLPDSPTVREVALELAGAMRAGGIVIDTSTTEPTVSIELAGALQERGIRFLDAPVSGGEKAAIDGTLSFMVGGDEEVFQECLDLLKTMGTTVVRMGGNGMGGAAKMVNQMIVGATFAVIAEGFALGVKSGLDPKVLYEAIRNGWAGSRVLEVSVPAMLERNFRPGGTVNIHYKDLGYALSLAKAKDVPTPVTAVVHEIFKAARAAGDGALSQPAIVMLWEKLLGMEVRPKTRGTGEGG